MPQTITIGAFVFGAVLLLIALLGGQFKIFGAEVSGKAGRLGRLVAGIAGIVFVIIGLVGPHLPSRDKVSAPSPPPLSSGLKNSKQTIPEPPPPLPPTGPKSTAKPQVVRRSLFRTALRTGVKLAYYDFDRPEELSKLTPAVDFWFKRDSSDKDTKIGVVPHNGAKFSPRSLDRFPWEVSQTEFTTAQGVYSIPQRVDIPCITNKRAYCTFKLWLEDDGKFVVSFVLYEIR